jgi:hypothetical protein
VGDIWENEVVLNLLTKKNSAGWALTLKRPIVEATGPRSRSHKHNIPYAVYYPQVFE